MQRGLSEERGEVSQVPLQVLLAGARVMAHFKFKAAREMVPPPPRVPRPAQKALLCY